MHQPSIENLETRQYQILIRLGLGILLCCLLLPICLHFDLTIAQEITYHNLQPDIRIFLSFTEVFGHFYGVALILTAIWFASPDRRRQVGAIVALLVINCLVITFLKNLIVRVRPREGIATQFNSVWETFHGFNPAITQLDWSQLGISNLQSYPSGHASTAFVLGVGLAIMYPGARYLFLCLPCLACVQRIGFQAHYLSDVCVGTIVGLVTCVVFLHNRRIRNGLLISPRWFPILREGPIHPNELQKSKAA